MAYLEHLKTIFFKFDADVVIFKPVLIFLFCNGLKLSIRAQTKQKGC